MNSARPTTLEQCWRVIAALDKRIADGYAIDLGTLTDEHRKRYDEQNALLAAMGEETLSVAEYLSCRLEDVEAELKDNGGESHPLEPA